MKNALILTALLLASPAVAGIGGSDVLYCGPKQVHATSQSSRTVPRIFSQVVRDVNDVVEGDEKLGLPANLREVKGVIKLNLDDLVKKGAIKKYWYEVFKEKSKKNEFYAPITADQHRITINYSRPLCIN